MLFLAGNITDLLILTSAFCLNKTTTKLFVLFECKQQLLACELHEYMAILYHNMPFNITTTIVSSVVWLIVSKTNISETLRNFALERHRFKMMCEYLSMETFDHYTCSRKQGYAKPET